MGRALLGWSPCAHITAPAAPSPPRGRSPLPIPGPGSRGGHGQTSLSPPGWGVQPGWPPVPAHGHPEPTGTALQGRAPAAEHGTEPFWRHWGSREEEEEEEGARKARLPAPAPHSPSLPTGPAGPHVGFSPSKSCDPAQIPPASASTRLPLRAPSPGPRVRLHPDEPRLCTCRYSKPFVSSNPIKVLRKAALSGA